jgi:hypothetical protein
MSQAKTRRELFVALTVLIEHASEAHRERLFKALEEFRKERPMLAKTIKQQPLFGWMVDSLDDALEEFHMDLDDDGLVLESSDPVTELATTHQ